MSRCSFQWCSLPGPLWCEPKLGRSNFRTELSASKKRCRKKSVKRILENLPKSQHTGPSLIKRPENNASDHAEQYTVRLDNPHRWFIFLRGAIGRQNISKFEACWPSFRRKSGQNRESTSRHKIQNLLTIHLPPPPPLSGVKGNVAHCSSPCRAPFAKIKVVVLELSGTTNCYTLWPYFSLVNSKGSMPSPALPCPPLNKLPVIFRSAV